MDLDKINEIIEKITISGEIKPSDIPSIDLYMDQITTLFEDKLGNTKRNEDEKILTKTMINNYTKAKAIMPPKNKKYSRQHMILMSLIYNMKQILSIHDIKQLLTPFINKLNAQDKAAAHLIEEIYSSFLEVKGQDISELNSNFEDVLSLAKEKSENLLEEDRDMASLLLLVLTLTERAALEKRLAESIIDEFFQTKSK